MVDWSSDVTRAALPQAVLAVLRLEPRHGYAMIEVLQQRGFDRIKGGTLYPLLRRLEEQGLVEHQWDHHEAGPGRKVFTLTDLGAEELDGAAAAWLAMTTNLEHLRTDRHSS